MSHYIGIVTAANEAYLPHVATMLQSLVTHNRGLHFRVYFLHRAATPKPGLDKLAQTAKQQGLDWHPISVPTDFTTQYPVNQQFPEEAWYRLKLQQLIPDTEKLLWLDADTVVLGSVLPLWNADLSHHPVAAVANHNNAKDCQHALDLGLLNHDDYFNSGVMLLDMVRWTKLINSAAIQQALKTIPEHIWYADQDILNVILKGNWYRLPPRWNWTTSHLFRPLENVRLYGVVPTLRAQTQATIAHFTGPLDKPWNYKSLHPYKHHYRHYRKIAGWGVPNYPDKNLRSMIMNRVPYQVRVVLKNVQSPERRRNLWHLLTWTNRRFISKNHDKQ